MFSIVSPCPSIQGGIKFFTSWARRNPNKNFLRNHQLENSPSGEFLGIYLRIVPSWSSWGVWGRCKPPPQGVEGRSPWKFLHFTLPKRLEIAFPAGLSAENSGTDIGSLYVYSRTKFYIINTIFGIEIGRASWDLAFLPGPGVPACPNIMPPCLSVCPSVSQSATHFSQNWLITFFWFFAWSQGTIDDENWRSPIFQENSYFGSLGQKGSKKGLK